MSLPSKVIDRLFSRLSVTYGAAWDRNLGSSPLSDVKTCWGHELSGFDSEEGLKCVAWALENLPERCPNVIEFRTLCRRSPMPERKQLDAPKADPVVVAAALERALSVRQAIASSVHDPKGWARNFVSRAEAGERIRPITLKFARQALGLAAA